MNYFEQVKVAMQQLYQCPGCGAPIAFGNRFCGNCGKQLNWQTQQQRQSPPQYQCPACNKPVTSNTQFCQNCGASLHWPGQQQTQPLQPESKNLPPESRHDPKVKGLKMLGVAILSLLLFL